MTSNTPRTIFITGARKGLESAAADDDLPQQGQGQGHQIIGVACNLPKELFPGEFFTVEFANSEQTKSILAELTARFLLI